MDIAHSNAFGRMPRAPRAGRRERGLTLWGSLYVLITLGLLGIVAMRSVPVYLHAYAIRRDIHWAAGQPELQNASARAIQNAIQRRFDAGYVSGVAGRDVSVRRISGGRELELRYEVRRPLLFNIATVYAFDETVKMAEP